MTHLRIWVSACVLFLASLVMVSAKPNDVEIVKVEKPENCDQLPKASQGKYVLVHFVARVDESSTTGKKGEVFQNSTEVGLPIVVHLEQNEVIPGWILALDNVCEKSKVTFVVPPDLGYGDDVTMRFDIDLLQVSDSPIEEPSLFDVLDTNLDGQITIDEFNEHFKQRPSELGPDGKPPLGLFMKDDINQNMKLNWEEFSGPKGTKAPSVAQAVIDKETADPELAKHKKGDPIKIKVSVNGDENADINKVEAKMVEDALRAQAEAAAEEAKLEADEL